MSQNYKDTLNLPRTDFPMKANLVTREPELLKMWDETRLYQRIQQSRKDRELFVLHDGPPFANGDVHMGTALNKILKDFVVKSQTMLGKRAPYVPGWDCHGLPIEYKVVKETRDLSPLEVRKRCDAFARKYVDLQREQFKRLGVLGDWEHPYLTLDPKYEAEILRAFAVFVEKGLVYQSKKPVVWSTGAQTALAEAEVEYQERDDTAVYVKFPIVSGEWKDKASIAIWTTTPWTLPANLAIAVDPKELYVVQEFSRDGTSETLLLADKRVPQFCAATKFEPTGEPLESFPGAKIDKIKARHPFLDREAIVLTADFVTMDTGTGAVHIAPGHGEDDYWLGKENKLPILSPVDDHGRLTDEAGLPKLTGKYVFDANADVVNLLRERGNLLGAQNFHHSYPYCWRSKTPIIFRNVEQFFIRIDDLRGQALKAIHNEVKWIPAWGENRIAGTVASHRGWFQSSLMTSIALNDRTTYKTCVTHGFVVDLDGKKISKSGTYDKPMDVGHFVGRHGADLVRLWACSIDYTDDVPFSEEMFTRLGDTYRRIRNTLRILLGNLFDLAPHPALSPGRGEDKGEESFAGATLVDWWALERLDQVVRDCRSAYEAFEFHKVYHALNQFCAVDLSSLYIDITKDRMYCDASDSSRRRATQTAMHEIFSALCQLLAPVIAFTAEEAWRHSSAGSSVHLEEFPKTKNRGDKASMQVADLLRLRGVIGQAIEKARQEKLIGNALEAAVVLRSDSNVTSELSNEELEEFFILSDLKIEQAKEASATVAKTPYQKF